MGTWQEFRMSVVLKTTDVLASSNYLINFFLYCLYGSYFRQQVIRQLSLWILLKATGD